MFKSPFICMKILSHQFLCGWLLRHILSKNTQFIQCQPAITTETKYKEEKKKKKKKKGKKPNQRRKTFISMSSQHRKPTMGTRIGRRQSLTERMNMKPWWRRWWWLFLHGILILLYHHPHPH